MNWLDIGRAELASYRGATHREWLVTNGLGGFASGTVAESNTRRYHGVLVAALTPPLGRTLTVAKLDAVALYGDREYPMTSNEFADGVVDPRGYRYLERFHIEHGLPIWEYALGDALVEKRIVMPNGENTTLIQYRVLRASASVELTVRPLCTYRDYHSHTQGGWSLGCDLVENGFRINAFDGARPYEIRSVGSADAAYAPEWYWGFRHRVEAERGLDDREDLFGPGTFHANLAEGEALTVLATTEASPSTDFPAAQSAEIARRQRLLQQAGLASKSVFVQQWLHASDQFVVERQSQSVAGGRTVIAGYPWFGDWGRDTMIALPGLTLTTKRYDVARDILRTFAEHIDRGMLPNRFPDDGEAPEYNTVDATLWYVQAVREYTICSRDTELAAELFDTLRDIVEWHRRGTRYGIHVDADDGLLVAGEESVQLTWMDAKVGDWVVTPRIGKAVEINALWYNALACMADLASRLNDTGSAAEFGAYARFVGQSFERFWSGDLGYLYDVIDGPEGVEKSDGRRYDPSLRPNQIFAASLPFSPLRKEWTRGVVDACAQHLVTSYGLRSLDVRDENYIGRYGGGPLERDGAYHQGTVWAWLLAPFAEAHFHVYGNPEQARSYLRPLGLHLREACIGSVSEIFDGDAPHRARGCFAQAWSVAELLRVWINLTTAIERDAEKEATT